MKPLWPSIGEFRGTLVVRDGLLLEILILNGRSTALC